MNEIWKDIKGYEGLYQVSNLGRVKSLDYNQTGSEQIRKAGRHRDGYLLMFLSKGGRKIGYLIHRLVAEAFLPNPDNLPEINHKDENKTNNVVTNLEWCDRKYNINFGTHNERISKAKSKAVYQYTKDGSLVGSYPSVKEVGRKTGYNQGHISACCNGKHKQAYGFIWSFSLIVPKGKLF